MSLRPRPPTVPPAGAPWNPRTHPGHCNLPTGPPPHAATLPAPRPNEADDQILAYIKGKVWLSLLVGSFTALVLLAIGLDLWLAFGVLAFWLNFVPNVGAVIAVFLPLPLVVLDPSMSLVSMILAFLLPFSVHSASARHRPVLVLRGPRLPWRKYGHTPSSHSRVPCMPPCSGRRQRPRAPPLWPLARARARGDLTGSHGLGHALGAHRGTRLPSACLASTP